MVDIVNREARSRMMSSVRAKNTRPELEIRHRLFAMGFRYRLYRKDLPGTPDMIFSRYRTVVFIHGCFWHRHGCHLSSIPETRRLWWKTKLEGNARRDSSAVSELQNCGWRVLTIWECGFRKPGVNRTGALDAISARVAKFLSSKQRLLEVPQLPVAPCPKDTGIGNNGRHGKKNA